FVVFGFCCQLLSVYLYVYFPLLFPPPKTYVLFSVVLLYEYMFFFSMYFSFFLKKSIFFREKYWTILFLLPCASFLISLKQLCPCISSNDPVHNKPSGILEFPHSLLHAWAKLSV